MDVARSVFAEKGIDPATIDDITERADVGKGTFYYHFKNKEEIILAIFESDSDTYTGEWDNADIPSLQRFVNIIRDVVLMWQDCKFFKKEMVTLVANDPALKSAYQQLNQTIVTKARKLFADLLQDGMLDPQTTPIMFEPILVISTLIANHWLTYLDLNDQPLTLENLQKGADLILMVWQPYMTKKALAELAQLKAGQE